MDIVSITVFILNHIHKENRFWGQVNGFTVNVLAFLLLYQWVCQNWRYFVEIYFGIVLLQNSTEISTTTYLPSPPDHELLIAHHMLIHGKLLNNICDINGCHV